MARYARRCNILDTSWVSEGVRVHTPVMRVIDRITHSVSARSSGPCEGIVWSASEDLVWSASEDLVWSLCAVEGIVWPPWRLVGSPLSGGGLLR